MVVEGRLSSTLLRLVPAVMRLILYLLFHLIVWGAQHHHRRLIPATDAQQWRQEFPSW
jgi:hypothetical protein